MNRQLKLSLLISMSFLSANSWISLAVSAPKIPSEVTEKAVTNIDFQLDEQNLQQFAVVLQAKEIKNAIAANLKEWSYPLNAAEGLFSHRLVAGVGLMKYGSTPAGFSFSSGNSDPRSPDFQKADVLPITCRLSRTDRPDASFELSGSFSAPKASEKTSANMTHELTDRLSTLCYDLLDKLPRKSLPKESGSPSQTLIKPNWIPNIRVEVQEKPVPAVNSTNISEPSVTVEEETQKSLIIHNQGNPLIITIGHERK